MKAKEKLNFEVEFVDSEISLDIPLSGGVKVDEWKILPLIHPMVWYYNYKLLVFVLTSNLFFYL